MTARSPLWYNSGDLQEMTSAEIVEWQEAAIFVYAQNPTAVLSVDALGTLIAQNVGTPIGNMSAGGGLAAAFDGDIENYNAGAQANATSGNIGKDFGSGVTKTVTGVVLKMLGNASIDGGAGTETMAFTVERSDNGTDFTQIYSETGISVTSAGVTFTRGGFTNTAAARYIRVSLSHGGGAETHVSEVEFYEDGGNVSPKMSDTRLQAGAFLDSSTPADVDDESDTAEPSTVTVTYDKVSVTYTDISGTSDSGTTFPVYYDGSGSIQAMTLTDFKDTFITPAIDLMIAASESNNTGGTYTITTSSTAATGYTNVSTTAIFVDTRADTSAYTAGGLPETQDQPTTINSYFLHRRNGADSTPSRNLIYVNGDNDLQEYAASDAKTLIGNWIRDEAGSSTGGNKITYSITADGSGGNARGTSMVDTKLNGSGNFQTGQETRSGTVFYYGQEFPNGTAATISTYTLRVTKA